MKYADMIREVADVLELPYGDRQGTAWKAVMTVFHTITHALQRGERVRVVGFGIFELRTKKAVHLDLSILHGLGVKHKRGDLITIQPKTYVHFKPTQPILRSLNNVTQAP